MGDGRTGTPAPGAPRARTRQVCARAGGAAEPYRFPFRVLQEKHGSRGDRGAPHRPGCCSGFPSGKSKHGDRQGTRDPRSAPSGVSQRKTQAWGGQGAPDPPGSSSGLLGGNLGAPASGTPAEPLGSRLGSPNGKLGSGGGGSSPTPWAPPAKKQRGPQDPAQGPPALGSGGTPGCGPTA